jgi:hypothetical protein
MRRELLLEQLLPPLPAQLLCCGLRRHNEETSQPELLCLHRRYRVDLRDPGMRGKVSEDPLRSPFPVPKKPLPLSKLLFLEQR